MDERLAAARLGVRRPKAAGRDRTNEIFDLRRFEIGVGRGDAIVCEQPDAIKTYLVRWNGVKVDLTQLAKLRWIEKRRTPDLCHVFGQKRIAIRQRLRTLRKCGISELNLTENERKIVSEQIKLEEAIYGGSDR